MTDRRETATPAKLDSILNTIQNLQGRIEDERMEDGPEKDLMRAHMERLIREYRISEEELLRDDAAAGRAPIAVPGLRSFRICSAMSEFRSAYLRMAFTTATHAECRITASSEWDGKTGTAVWVAKVVGYEGDARYAEALFTEARTFFANRMEPQVDPRASDEDNVYRLRSAGIERGRIGEMMGWGGEGTPGPARVTRVYKKACAALGVDASMTGRSTSVKVFREAFAEEFPSTLNLRLQLAQASAGGAEVVLGDRKQRVTDEFYRLFPHLRPTEVATTDKTPAKPKKPREPKWTKKDQARWDRINSDSARLGRSAGTAAANEVNVKGATPGTGSIEG